jgi:hypothetical protein
MMEKIIGVGSWDSAGDNPTQLVKVSSRGLAGADRTDFLKRASHVFVDKLDNLKLAADELPIHVIAINATEHYGCFAAGTRIALPDGTYCPIENLTVGTDVLTADGNVKPVTTVFRRDVEAGQHIVVSGLIDPLKCSLDHPFRVARREQFACRHDKYKRCLPPIQGRQNICLRVKHLRECVVADLPSISTEWATATTLRKGDFLVWTAPNLVPPVMYTAAECYLLGAWLAEGSYQKIHGVVRSAALACGRDEWDFVNRIADAALASNLTLNSYDYSDGAKAYICVHVTGNPALFRAWKTYFNEHAYGKRIPPWVCCWPREQRLALLAGYLDGDGHYAVSDKENRVTASSASYDLACGMQRLAWSLGLPAVVCRHVELDDNRLDRNILSLPTVALEELEPYSYKFRARELKQLSKVHGFWRDNRMYLPVRSIEPINDPFPVFNLEIADDHTYSGPNVDSHNCNRNGDGFNEAACRKYHDTFVKHARHYEHHSNKDPAKSFGDVRLSAYNEPMHRIELLVVGNLSKEAAQRNGGLVLPSNVVDKLERGDDVGWSMACKVAYDVCSICGNKAPNRDHYCTEDTCRDKQGRAGLGCKDGLTKLCSDGRQQFVDNPEPLFFDISRVWRPADRQAYGWKATYLEKAAACQRVAGGAELAEQYNPDWPLNRHMKLAAALAAAELDLYTHPTTRDVACATAFDPSIQPRLSSCAILGQVGSSKQATALRALANQKIVLPLRDFVSVLLGDASSEKTAAIAASVTPHLHGVFNRLASASDLDAQLASNVFQPAPNLVPASVQSWAAKLAGDYSLEANAIRQRAERAAIKQARPVTIAGRTTKTASADGPAKELARLYALYKLAALAEMPLDETNEQLTVRAAVLQNMVS